MVGNVWWVTLEARTESLWQHEARSVTKECLMCPSRVLICRVDDPAADHMTELAAFDLTPADIPVLQPDTALDDLETTTQEAGNAILRRTLQAQWDRIDTDE